MNVIVCLVIVPFSVQSVSGILVIFTLSFHCLRASFASFIVFCEVLYINLSSLILTTSISYKEFLTLYEISTSILVLPVSESIGEWVLDIFCISPKLEALPIKGFKWLPNGTILQEDIAKGALSYLSL